jgi:hypothetical protein
MTDETNVVQLNVGRNRAPDWDVIYNAYLQGVTFRDLARMPEAAGITPQAVHLHAKSNGWVRDESAEARIRARQDVAFYADQEARQAQEWVDREQRMAPKTPKRRGRPPGSRNKPKDEAQATPEERIIREAKPARPLRIVGEDDGFPEEKDIAEGRGEKGEGPICSWPVDAQPLPGPEPDPLPSSAGELTPAQVQARNLTRTGVRQQRRITELHEIYRTMVHGFKMLAGLPTDHEDFAYFASKFLGSKDSLADLARKIAYVNGLLQRDERVAFDMNAERQEELKPFVPQLGRRASPLAGVNPYRNGTITPAPEQPAQDDADEKKDDGDRVADAG